MIEGHVFFSLRGTHAGFDGEEAVSESYDEETVQAMMILSTCINLER